MTSFKLVCPECKIINVTCEHEKLVVSSKWRPPRKDNIKAWKRIAAGEIWWDRNAINRKAVKSNCGYNNRMFRGKEAVLEELAERRKAVLARIERAKQEKQIGPPECQHEFCMWSYKKAISYYPDYEHYEGCPRGPTETTKLS